MSEEVESQPTIPEKFEIQTNYNWETTSEREVDLNPERDQDEKPTGQSNSVSTIPKPTWEKDEDVKYIQALLL